MPLPPSPPTPGYNKSAAREAVAAYTRLAAEHGLSPTQLALAFVASRWFVSSTIVGATSVAQLRDNLDAFDVRLSPQVLTAVAELHRRFRDPATG